MKISSTISMSKKVTSIAHTLSKRASYSKGTSYAFQRVQSESFLSRKFIEAAELVILGSTSLLISSMSIFIAQE